VGKYGPNTEVIFERLLRGNGFYSVGRFEVKEFSEEVLKVLEDALTKPEFLNMLLRDPDWALHVHDLKPEEAQYLKSLDKREKIEYVYNQAIRGSVINRKLSGVSLWLAGLLALVLLAYPVISLYSPDALTSLGIPLWEHLDAFLKLNLMLYGLVLGAATAFGLVRTVSRMKTARRTILSFAVVVLMFIPGSVVLNSLSEETQLALIRVLLVLIFTVLPPLFYWLFIAAKGKTLWEEFAYNLVCLEPTRYQTLIPIYRKKYEAIYSSAGQDKDTPNLLRGEASLPVILMTFIVGLGWILFFSAPGESPGYLMGRVTTFTFGFLGAYLFSLQMLFRRYVQSDLKPTAYSHASQRILVTWIWSYVLSILPWEQVGIDIASESQITPILAFLVGIFPEIALQVISLIIKRMLAFPLPNFRQGNPLSQIDGITVWVEARLLEEDIENVQNLVTADVLDLMLKTNLRPERIINWIDQGILRLHLGRGKADKSRDTMETALQERGIVKAMDLLEAFYAFQKARRRSRDKSEPFIDTRLDAKVFRLVEAIDNDPNMYYVKAWSKMSAELIGKLPEAIEQRIGEGGPMLDWSEIANQREQDTDALSTVTLFAQELPGTQSAEANAAELEDVEVEGRNNNISDPGENG
jgi:hypothetical protein